MYVVCVTLWIKKGSEQAFVEASKDNHLNTRKEPGNVRFDVLRKEDEPGRFFLYEVYKEKEDFIKHQQTPHYMRWKETVTPLQEQPRQGVKHLSIFPEEWV